MKTFSINTLGCKVNQYESQQIRELLERMGLEQVKSLEQSDLIVVNSCCVTHTASAKSRRQINRIQSYNPDSTVVVTGCLLDDEILNFNQKNDKIHLIKYRESIATTLKQIIYENKVKYSSKTQLNSLKNAIRAKSDVKINCKSKLPNRAELCGLTAFKGQTRAFLKVQDGCDGWCSYCIIPKTRPRLNSKDIDVILHEAQGLVNAGHKEITLTGIFLGAYGQETVQRRKWKNGKNQKLLELVGKLAEVEGLKRLRLSSLEPADVSGELLEIFCKNRNIMPHLHLSLQSGSDMILKRMCRQYTIAEFRDKAEMIKDRIDRPAITTDLIAGFPGETDKDFAQSIDIARDIGFAKMHVFPFSARKGTAAEKMEGKIEAAVIAERAKELRELSSELERSYREQFIGEKAEVIIEKQRPRVYGRSERYFTVFIKQNGKLLRKNDLVTVKLTGSGDDGLIGALSISRRGRDF